MSDARHEPPHDDAFPLNPETARIVLCLDDAISAFRVGEASGIHALDSASRLTGELSYAPADEASTDAAAWCAWAW